MFAPKELVATGPAASRAAAVNLVVVVLPLVPDINATCRPAASIVSRRGSMVNPTLPPITDPSPRPLTRDRVAAVRSMAVANLARAGRLVTSSSHSSTHVSSGKSDTSPLPDDVH